MYEVEVQMEEVVELWIEEMVGAEMGTGGDEVEGAEVEEDEEVEEEEGVEEDELRSITGSEPLLTNPSSLKGWSNIIGSAYVCVTASDSMYCSTAYGM
jgi:hypothetical protein